MTFLLAALRPALPVILGLMLAVGLITAVYWIGQRDGAAKVQAEWAAEREALRAAEAKVVARREAEEARIAQHLKEQTDAHAARIKDADAALAAASRELVRLRAAAATAQRTRDVTAPATTGPAPHGATADPGQLLGECAGEAVRLGAEADRLAAQVIGLQGYARVAQQACGS